MVAAEEAATGLKVVHPGEDPDYSKLSEAGGRHLFYLQFKSAPSRESSRELLSFAAAYDREPVWPSPRLPCIPKVRPPRLGSSLPNSKAPTWIDSAPAARRALLERNAQVLVFNHFE
jgi:hypothetical protein